MQDRAVNFQRPHSEHVEHNKDRGSFESLAVAAGSGMRDDQGEEGNEEESISGTTDEQKERNWAAQKIK